MKLTYQDLLDEFTPYIDKKFQEFSKKIVNSQLEVLGVKTPIIKSLVKKYSALNVDISEVPYHKNFETDLFIGLYNMKVLSNSSQKYEFISNFLSGVDNWAIVDQISSSFKNKNVQEVFAYALKCVDSSQEFIRRFAYIHLLTNAKNSEECITFMNTYCRKDSYYVMMGEAWLLSVLYLHFPRQVEKILLKSNTPKFIVNKTISKICDSYRVNIEDKERLRQYRIK